MTRFAVFGAGSWGTAFSLVLADAGNDVMIWGRREELCREINVRHENPDYLPGVELPPGLRATHDPQEALDHAHIVVLALPAQHLRAHLRDWAPLIEDDALIVTLSKGIEIGTSQRMSQVIAEVTGASPGRVAAVSGPNLSHEIAAREPAAAVVACPDPAAAATLQSAFHTPSFRPYTTGDIVGVEIGGAVKNVIAVACGIAQGLGFGDNTRASIITRGLAEITRLGVALGAEAPTFAGLAGVGDLVATCSSPLSRNRGFGERLGRGETVAQVVAATRQVAEGVKSCEAILDLARGLGVDVPIVEHVVAIVRDGAPAADIGRSLMSREAGEETPQLTGR